MRFDGILSRIKSHRRGAVSPGAEILHQICSSFGVSADWLLGLPERGGTAAAITGNTGAVAIGTGAKARSGTDCSKCKLMQAQVAGQSKCNETF